MRPISLLLLALLLTACGKKEEISKSDAPLAEEQSSGTQLAPEQAAKMEMQFLPSPKSRPAKTIQERLEGSVHAQLTAKLRIFKTVKGRMPENFYEFANTVGDGVPPLPDGMKYVIDPTDETVKAVMK